jgi:hypothetical protein
MGNAQRSHMLGQIQFDRNSNNLFFPSPAREREILAIILGLSTAKQPSMDGIPIYYS